MIFSVNDHLDSGRKNAICLPHPTDRQARSVHRNDV